jgi:hypothetical protein
MENGMQTKDQEITILKVPAPAPAANSVERRSVWKTLFSFPYSVELMDSLMAFVGLLMSVLALVFVLTVFIEHLYHLFSKN